MNIQRSRSLISIVVFAVLLFNSIACRASIPINESTISDENKNSASDYPFDDFAVGYTGDLNYAVAAFHQNGELLVAITDTNTYGDILNVKGAVFQNDDDVFVVVYRGPDGLPEKMVTNDTIYLFSNYTADTVDLGIIYPDGSSEIQREKPLIKEAKDAIRELSLVNKVAALSGAPDNKMLIGKALKVSIWLIKGAACASGVIPACVSVALSVLSEFADSELIGAASMIPSLLSCAGGDVIECWSFVVEGVTEVIRLAENILERREEAIGTLKREFEEVREDVRAASQQTQTSYYCPNAIPTRLDIG